MKLLALACLLFVPISCYSQGYGGVSRYPRLSEINQNGPDPTPSPTPRPRPADTPKPAQPKKHTTPRRVDKQQTISDPAPTPLPPTPTPQPVPEKETWTLWAANKAIGWGLDKLAGLIVFVSIWPSYKAGFYVRQGLEHKVDLDRIHSLLAENNIPFNQIKPEYKEQINSYKKKSKLMLIGAFLFIGLLIALPLYVGSWKLPLCFLALSVIGFFNVNGFTPLRATLSVIKFPRLPSMKKSAGGILIMVGLAVCATAGGVYLFQSREPEPFSMKAGGRGYTRWFGYEVNARSFEIYVPQSQDYIDTGFIIHPGSLINIASSLGQPAHFFVKCGEGKQIRMYSDEYHRKNWSFYINTLDPNSNCALGKLWLKAPDGEVRLHMEVNP